MQELINILRTTHCSLVVKDKSGNISTYCKPGVRDLEQRLNHQPEMLKGASVADKVTGRAAASMAVVGGVACLYAEVMSQAAIPFLEKAGITYSYGTLVTAIEEDNNGRCQLERITAPASTAEEAVRLLRAHFAEMQAKTNINNGKIQRHH